MVDFTHKKKPKQHTSIHGNLLDLVKHVVKSSQVDYQEADKADAQIEGKQTASLNLKIGLKRKEVATWAGDEELAAAVGKVEENE